MHANKNSRNGPKSKEMETELISKYFMLYRRSSGNKSSPDSSTSEYSDSEDLKVNDGFSGEFQHRQRIKPQFNPCL